MKFAVALQLCGLLTVVVGVGTLLGLGFAICAAGLGAVVIGTALELKAKNHAG